MSSDMSEVTINSNIIEESIQRICNIVILQYNDNISFKDYMKYYSYIYDLMIKDNSDEYGKNIYEIYTKYIDKYLSENVLPIITNCSNEQLIRSFIDLYEKCSISGNYLKKIIFQYFERFYVVNEDLADTCVYILKSFYENVFKEIKNRIDDCIKHSIHIIRTDESDSIISPTSTKLSELQSISKIYYDMSEKEYKELTENIFKESEEYYKLYYTTNFNDNIETYYTMINKIYKKEENIFTFIPNNKNLEETLNNYLIYQYKEFIENSDYILSLLKSNIYSDNTCQISYKNIDHYSRVSQIYNILMKVDFGLNTIINNIEKLIDNIIIDIENQFNDNNLFIDNIIKFYTKIVHIINKCMPDLSDTLDTGNISIIHSIDKKYRSYTSKNITLSGCKKTSFTSMFVYFLHYSIKKFRDNEINDDIVEDIDGFMALFKIISEKDLFLELYSEYLSKRLLFDKYNIDLEVFTINKLKDICGKNYTYKLENMIKDVSNKYLPEINKMNNTKILTAAFWPDFTHQKHIIPANIYQLFKDYEEKYHEKYTGRKLKWVLPYSLISLDFEVNEKYTIILPIPEASILMMFQDKNQELSIDHISGFTKYSKEEIINLCSKLVKINIIYIENNNTTIRFNSSFKSKRKKICIPVTLNKQNVNEKKSQEITDKERKHIIEALIVRIMKSRKKLDHNSLISEIFSQKLLFEPSIKLIKNSLESLIDREYIERNDENINEYSYIS